MNFKKSLILALTTLAVNVVVLENSYAASIDVKCETRKTLRSKVSVDGAGFARGVYRATVTSGDAAAINSKTLKRPINGELEFDFDSKPADIASGATAIPATFIKDNSVTGKIYSYNATSKEYKLLASITETCRAR